MTRLESKRLPPPCPSWLQVEAIVRSKMEQREYIIMCLEDTNDWNNATTRRLVMQVRHVVQRGSEAHWRISVWSLLAPP